MRLLVTAVATTLLAAPLGVRANLNQLAKAAGKLYFGSATDNSELSDTAYAAILKNVNEFGQITPANTQKWQYVEPSNGVFSYTQGDVITNFARANGQILRCHNLVWHNQLPSWVSSGAWTAAQLTDIINAHIASEVGHYKGQCYAWDVVNEALNDDGTYRTDVFYNVLGKDYIPLAFKAAAAADPAAKLYYNDYNIEYTGAKLTAALGIVKNIQASGARIDGVGLQGHFIVGGTPGRSSLAAVLKQLVALNVEVAYTELDVRFSNLPASAAQYTQQATDYSNVVAACLDVPACVGVTVWDFDDRYSWVPSTFSGAGEACLFWQNLTAKPAYYAIQSLLSSAAGTGTVPVTSAAPSTTKASTAATTPATTIITSIKPSTTAVTSSVSSAGAAARWSQCGGIGWKGATACASPYSCQKQNDYYSQCL